MANVASPSLADVTSMVNPVQISLSLLDTPSKTTDPSFHGSFSQPFHPKTMACSSTIQQLTCKPLGSRRCIP